MYRNGPVKVVTDSHTCPFRSCSLVPYLLIQVGIPGAQILFLIAFQGSAQADSNRKTIRMAKSRKAHTLLPILQTNQGLIYQQGGHHWVRRNKKKVAAQHAALLIPMAQHSTHSEAALICASGRWLHLPDLLPFSSSGRQLLTPTCHLGSAGTPQGPRRLSKIPLCKVCILEAGANKIATHYCQFVPLCVYLLFSPTDEIIHITTK